VNSPNDIRFSFTFLCELGQQFLLEVLLEFFLVHTLSRFASILGCGTEEAPRFGVGQACFEHVVGDSNVFKNE
jgi:hypothetical protein